MTIIDIRLAVREILGDLWDQHYGPGMTYADLAALPELADHSDLLLEAHADWLEEALDAKPTATGLARYVEDPGHYTHQVVEGVRYACVCSSSCRNPCRGECTCAACTYAAQDWERFGSDDQQDLVPVS